MGSPHSARWLWTGVVACVAGVLCKEVMVTAPFTVVVYDRVFLFASFREAFHARWRFYAGLALTWLILAGSMLSHGSISSGGFQSAQTTTWTYMMNQTVIVTRYLRLVVWPRPLVLYYGWTRALTLADVWPYALFIAILVIVAAVVFFRWPRFGFPAAWTIITLSPSSSIAKIAAEVGAERRMYLPLMGIVTLVVVGAALFLRSRTSESSAGGAPASSGRVLVGASVAIAVLLGASTFARARDYSSALTMARTILAGWESPSAHQLVGQELSAAGQRDEAIKELRLALPDATPARYFLGIELVNAGQYDEGIEQLQEFIRLEPSIAPVKTARMSLARAYAAKQRWPEAIAELNAVSAADPNDSSVHGVLANVLAGQQKFADAVPHYEAYIKANPRDANAWTGLGIALISLGKTCGRGAGVPPGRHRRSEEPAVPAEPRASSAQHRRRRAGGKRSAAGDRARAERAGRLRGAGPRAGTPGQAGRGETIARTRAADRSVVRAGAGGAAGDRRQRLEEAVESAHDTDELSDASNREQGSGDIRRGARPAVVLQREPLVLLAELHFEPNRMPGQAHRVHA